MTRKSHHCLWILLLLSAVGVTACKNNGTGPDPETTGYSKEVLADAPIAYWRFEEITGDVVVDSSGQNHHGTFVDSPVLAKSVGGKTGYAFEFLTSSDGVFNAGGSWTQVGSISAEAWIRANSVTSPEGMIILDKGGSWNLLISPNGRPSFHFPHTGDEVFGPTAIQAGQTYHLVATFDAGVMKLYVNGELVGQISTVAQIVPEPSADAPIHVGRGWGEFRWEFYGIIDEPAIYNRVLTAAAVLNHYNAGK